MRTYNDQSIRKKCRFFFCVQRHHFNLISRFPLTLFIIVYTHLHTHKVTSIV